MSRFSKILMVITSCVVLYTLLVYLEIIDFSSNEPFELISDLDNQKFVKPQELILFGVDSGYCFKISERAVSSKVAKYKFSQKQYEVAELVHQNPFGNDSLVIAKGRVRFNTFCSPCHGVDALGGGAVVTKVQLGEDDEAFPQPPSLLRTQARQYSDGRIFHIISAGQNIMLPQAPKLSIYDRWCVVRYIRYLQSQ